MAKPKYNTARGEADLKDLLQPPFSFKDVTARVFPLKAKEENLKKFCESYLNDGVPKKIASFQPALPYVFLAVLHYGKMSSDGSGNTPSGKSTREWISQHEIAFLIPLEWRREGRGVDWAFIAPFIFVDDDLSLTTGREVYGWPKVAARLDREIDPWIEDPRKPTHLMTMHTAGFLSASRGKKEEFKKLLEIDLKSPSALGQFPPDLSNPFNLLLNIPRAILAPVSATYDWLEILQNASRQGVAKSIKTLLDFLSTLSHEKNGDSLSLNQITLKQFRDARKSASDDACYQALVKSCIEITKTNHTGLLGDINLLQGDLTGGFQLLLHHQNAPEDTGELILKTLGLEYKQGEGSTEAILKPIYPFWAEVELRYDKGETIAWCADGSEWVDGPNKPPPPARGVAGVQQAPPKRVRFRTEVGGTLAKKSKKSLEQREVILSIYPLLAKRDELQKFCKKYLDGDNKLYDGKGVFPELRRTPYVYLIVLSRKDKKEGWGLSEVAFSIPVYWGTKQNKELVLVSPFIYAEADVDAILDREQNGRPAVDARLEEPGIGLVEVESNFEYPLMTVKTEVLVENDKAEERLLLEIYRGNALKVPEHEAEKDAWQEKLRQCQLDQDYIDPDEAFNAEILGRNPRRIPIKSLTLKQFRDADKLDRACYQAIVQSQWEIDFKQVESPNKDDRTPERYVKIFHHDSQPIVKTLALERLYEEKENGIAVAYLQPISPFLVRAEMTQRVQKNLYRRVNDEEWE